MVDLAAFNVKTRITEALDLFSDAKATIDDLNQEGSSRRLSVPVYMANESLEEG